jgi:hypothetical protein
MAVELRTDNPASIGAVLGNLVENTSHLVRQEINLVKAEVKEQVSETARTTGKGAVLLAGGGLLALLALGFLGLAGVFGLTATLGWQLWVSALVVTLVYLVLGGLLAFLGWRTLQAATPATEPS